MIAHQHDSVAKANEEFHDEFVDYYEDYYRNIIFFEANQRRILEHLRRLREKSSGGVLLDLGCGTGNIGRLARDIFETSFGIDISAKSLEKAAPFYDQVFKHDVCQLKDFDDNSVDLVTGYSLLHHIVDPTPIFRECHRILKPTGSIYFDNDPNSAFFVFALRSYLPGSFLDWVERQIPANGNEQAHRVIDKTRDSYKLAEFHHHYGSWFEGFFPRAMRRMLTRCGFRNISIQLYNIDRQSETVDYVDYSFTSQFRYSQMCVTAERGEKPSR